MLREYVFKTSSGTNLLCRWTRGHPGRWILIQLLRGSSRARADAAIFTLHGPADEIDHFLKAEFGKKYGTYEVHRNSGTIVSVEVTNYLLPAYRGQDPIELATRLLGADATFAPILVHDGYIHVRVIAPPPDDRSAFPQLLQRVRAVTHPEDFQLVHAGPWDPLQTLLPRDESLTARQTEVLRAAIEFGYYDEPRRCTLEAIAKAFGVSKAAVHKQLVGAESKVLKRAMA